MSEILNEEVIKSELRELLRAQRRREYRYAADPAVLYTRAVIEQ